MVAFAALQTRLGAALALNRPGSRVPHVLVVLPSFSIGESLLSHYASRIPALEHRYLLSSLLLARIESCEIVFVTSQAPSLEVLEYYRSLVPPERRDGMRSRLRLLVVPDRTPRPVAAKLLERPDLVDELRRHVGGRPGFIEPWNVTDDEVALACALQLPVNGTAPDLWPLGFKSAGRRLFAKAGVPVPLGREDVRTADEVAEAALAIWRQRPDCPGVVVKTDNSGAGDGNRVIRLAPATSAEEVRAAARSLPEWYRADLRAGGIVEELVTGAAFASPSAQVDIPPYGEPLVVSTHDQVLGGADGQVYTGCRFPADPAYSAQIARHARAVAQVLAARGAVGRLSVDFAARQAQDGRWDVFALEINLRKGGTTHPYSALRHLVSGRYDVESGQWVTDRGERRCYVSTDNLVDPRRLGMAPGRVISLVAGAGLEYDRGSGTGVVLHMLSCLAIDGRFGMTAIGSSPEQAAAIYRATEELIAGHTPGVAAARAR